MPTRWRDCLVTTTPQWLIGEGAEKPEHLLDRHGKRTIPVPSGPDDHYPDDYAGYIDAVRPMGWRWTHDDLRGGRKVVRLDLTDQEAGWLVARTRKIINGKREKITFNDRWGSRVADRLRLAFDDAEDAELKSMIDPDDYYGRMFAKQSWLFKKLLTPCVVHTGAGLYEVGPAKTYSVWGSAVAQLFTDQGSASFTATQYIRGFADTYAETVAPSSSLNPSRSDGYSLILEGDSADSRSNIIIQPPSGRGFSINLDTIVIRHLTVLGSSGDDAILITSSCFWALVTDCVVTAQARDGIDSTSDTTVIEFCAISTADHGIIINGGIHGTIRSCTITATGGKVDHGVTMTSPCDVSGCIIQGFDTGLHANGSTCGSFRSMNNVIHNCNEGIRLPISTAADGSIVNNIITSCGRAIEVTAWPDEVGEGSLSGPYTLLNNIFYNNTTFAKNHSGASRTFAQFIAMDMVDASGNTDGVDPDLDGNFAPNVGSPAIKTGYGSGVRLDVNGAAFDPFTPDIGAVSTGVVPVAAAPTWAANTSNIVATDLALDGEVGLAWDAATPDASGSVGYIIESQLTAAPGTWAEEFRTIQTVEIVGGLTNATGYDFRVKAYTRVASEPTTTPADTDSATPTAAGAPTAPAISATDLLNQSDVRVDVVADNPADVSTIYYQITPGGSIVAWGTPITGDGSETLTLTVAPYAIYAVAARGGCNSIPSNIEYLTVKAANQFTNIRTALREWIKGVVGDPAVNFAETNAPQSLRPFVTLKMGPTITIGSDHHGGNDATGVETVTGTREFVLSVQVHGKPANADQGEVASIMEQISSSLEKRSIQATLAAAGLTRGPVAGTGDLSGIGGTQWEARAFKDFGFRLTHQDTDDVGLINTVETPEGTLTL